MKKNIYKLLSIITVLCISLFGISYADVGNFESYDSYDSFDSDWGSSSSWDSDWDYDSDYDYSYSGSSSSGDLTGAEFIIVIIFIIIFIYCKKHNINPRAMSTNSSNNYSSRTIEKQVNTAAVLAKIKQADKFFNEANFLAWAKNLFVKLQNAWTERNFETIRTFETPELFEQHSNQIKQYINNKQINVMDRIAVNYAKLYSFEQDNDKDTLSIILNSSMLDYIIDEETKNVIQGSKTTRRTNTYKMTFIRKKGVFTAESTDEVKTTNCPNCGAPTHITSSGKCEYCASIITTGDHDWVLSNLEPFRG